MSHREPRIKIQDSASLFALFYEFLTLTFANFRDRWKIGKGIGKWNEYVMSPVTNFPIPSPGVYRAPLRADV